MNKIICGDALESLRELPAESVQMCVTSPPYYGLRDYNCDGQIGLEQTPAEYIERLVGVFREVWRVLMPDATLWLNIADSYAGSGKGAMKESRLRQIKNKQSYKFSADNPAAKLPKTWKGVKPKDMIGIPWALAFALRDDGWYLRSDIIWHKPNPLPESCKDRPTRSYEHLFLLSKSYHYYYDHEAIKEPVAEDTHARMRRAISNDHKYATGAPGQTPQTFNRPRESRDGVEITFADTRNKRDVWSIATKSYRGAHFATYPVELVLPCILAGCPEGGTVLDPFFGSGTTGEAAAMLGRHFIGIDLNSEFCQLAQNRLEGHAPVYYQK